MKDSKNIYGYVYLTTNLVNGKRYVGVHHGEQIDEKYIGSGIILLKSLKKYGRENFINGIIEFGQSIVSLSKRERFWIKEFGTLTSQNGYNVSIGGNIRGELSQSAKDSISCSLSTMGVCIHCGAEMTIGNLAKYHNERCLENPYLTEVDRIKIKDDRRQHRKICKYCGKTIPVNLHGQLHGENCLQNPNIDNREELLRRAEYHNRCATVTKKKCVYCQQIFDIGNYSNYHGRRCLKNPDINIEEELKRRREQHLGRNPALKIKCQHCNKLMDAGNFKQFHGAHCLENPNIDTETELMRRKLTQSNRINPIKIKCPYCNKFVDPGNYKQYHGSNCKKNLKNKRI